MHAIAFLFMLADAAIREIARVAEEVNTSVDNIGARRLHTVLERILEDVSYEAPERVGHVPLEMFFVFLKSGQQFPIDDQSGRIE